MARNALSFPVASLAENKEQEEPIEAYFQTAVIQRVPAVNSKGLRTS
jgi:hypothetical protein